MNFFSAFFLCLMTFFSPLFGEKIRHLPWNPSVNKVVKLIKQYLPENCIILEAGGFNGKDTVKLSKKFPHGEVYVFEPIPSLFEIIVNRAKDISNIHPYQLALGDFNGETTMHVSSANNSNDVSGSSSLLAPKEHLKYASWVKFPYDIQVNVATLDSWASQENITHVDLMWLDMQGHELNMLKNSEIAKKAIAIFLEVNFVEAYKGQGSFEEIQNWMKENHFSLIATDFDIKNYLNPKNLAKGFFFGNALYLKD